MPGWCPRYRPQVATIRKAPVHSPPDLPALSLEARGYGRASGLARPASVRPHVHARRSATNSRRADPWCFGLVRRAWRFSLQADHAERLIAERVDAASPARRAVSTHVENE